jgi:subfamily B ATP-binding cassette protein HlyB/CyaB
LTVVQVDHSWTSPDEPGATSTLLESLIIVARHRGLHLSLPQLIREHMLEGGEVSVEQLIAIARAAKLKATSTKLGERGIAKLTGALPVIVMLRNGNAMALLRVDERTGGALELTLHDPKAGGNALLVLDMPRFAEAFTGEVILVKHIEQDADEETPFGWDLIFAEITRDRALIRDIVIAGFLTSVLGLAPILFFRLLFDAVLTYRSLNTLAVLCVMMALLVAFEAAFGYLRRYMVLHISRRIEVNISTTIFSRLLRLPIEFFERSTAGEISRDVNETWKIRRFLSENVFGTALEGLVILVILPILFFFNFTLTMIVLLIAALVFGWLLLMMPVARRKAGKTHRAEGLLGGYLVETLIGIRTVKSLALEPRRRHTWDRYVRRVADLREEEGRTVNTIQTVILPLERLMTSGVFALAVYFAITGNDQVSVGALMAFVMLTTRLVAPLSNLALLLPAYDEARISVQSIARTVNQPPEEGRLSVGVRSPIGGRVEFSNVRFRYQGASTLALDDVSFTVPAGTIFGIVGRSGSGKTTVTRLLQMLNGGYEGLIKIDDKELRAIDLDHLRSNVGIVLQENFLFRGTVGESIAAAKPDATPEEIIAAAELAGADEFIERLPHTYNTWINEGAPNLSGGQRQRIAIARALITNPRVLILDEATSALDAESEAVINRNLLRMARQRTLLIISHRLSSLVAADAIMVLEKGRVYAVGTHEQLLAKCDIYRNLWFEQHPNERPRAA